MNPMPVSKQGSGFLHTNWLTARNKRDPKAEGRGSKLRTLQPSVFSLLHPSHVTRQSRFAFYPQSSISWRALRQAHARLLRMYSIAMEV
jgi:hypothetical protein